MDSRIQKMFEGIQDPRIERTKKHPLETLLFIVMCGSLAGISSWTGFQDYAEAHQETLALFVDFPEGIPSHDTLFRVISALNIDEFYSLFDNFVKQLSSDIKGIIAIDGKTIRGSVNRKKNTKACHIVSAWTDACKLVLAQVKVHEKSNEVTAIPDLLDMFEVKDQIITIDAMGAQRSICEKIIKKEGDYVISLKGNQGNLYEDIDLFFNDKDLKIDHVWEEADKGHGRIEHRLCRAAGDINWLLERHNWPGLRSIACVESTRETRKGKTTEKRYYISSLDVDAERIARAARAHWGIENCVHWVLDMTFNEDGCRIRTDNAPEILSIIRKWAMNLLNQHKGKLSLKRLTDKIAMNPKNLISILEKI